MSDNSKKNVQPIIIENFNVKNYFNDIDIKKINDNKKFKITDVAKYSITKPLHKLDKIFIN